MRIIDFHCDTILKLMDVNSSAELRKNNFSIDIEKLRAGHSLAQFFALFVDMKKTSDPLDTGLAMMDKFYTEIEKNSSDIAFAGSHEEILKNDASGKISALLTVEEGGVLKGKMHNLHALYRLGVRLITLTWNYPNEIGFPHKNEEYRTLGLTQFGKDVVAEMNRLGMIVDVSHLSDVGFDDVANLSDRPFVASHSNARAVCNHSRNLTDSMIRRLADAGGVMGINFEKSFLSSAPVSRVEDMVAHIRHIYHVGGIDVLAVGSDFDGICPELELENMGQIEKLINALSVHGFSSDEIEKIMYRNAFRVIKEVLI
jgi:membrane dipeptidase